MNNCIIVLLLCSIALSISVSCRDAHSDELLDSDFGGNWKKLSNKEFLKEFKQIQLESNSDKAIEWKKTKCKKKKNAKANSLIMDLESRQTACKVIMPDGYKLPKSYLDAAERYWVHN